MLAPKLTIAHFERKYIRKDTFLLLHLLYLRPELSLCALENNFFLLIIKQLTFQSQCLSLIFYEIQLLRSFINSNIFILKSTQIYFYSFFNWSLVFRVLYCWFSCIVVFYSLILLVYFPISSSVLWPLVPLLSIYYMSFKNKRKQISVSKFHIFLNHFFPSTIE